VIRSLFQLYLDDEPHSIRCDFSLVHDEVNQRAAAARVRACCKTLPLLLLLPLPLPLLMLIPQLIAAYALSLTTRHLCCTQIIAYRNLAIP
jgi:hypothetical protein